MKNLVTLVLLPMLLATADAAPALYSSTHSVVKVSAPPISSQAVLFDQNSDDAGIGTVSQNFENAYEVYVSQGADDFNVPPGSCWEIASINVTGVYFNGTGPANSVNVTFYRNNGSAPNEDKIIASFRGIEPNDNAGTLSIALPTAVKAKPGNYWVSVQANLDFHSGGQWAWETRQSQVGRAAAWKNPAGGFDTGCLEYGVMTSCFSHGQGPDYMFALGGKSKAC